MKLAEIRHGLNQEYALSVRVQEEGDPEFNREALALGRAKAYYDLGYIIVRDLFSADICDYLVNAFKLEVKPYQGNLWRQISMENEPHKIRHGLMVTGFLDTHDVKQFPVFRRTASELISDINVQWIIQEIIMRQPMLIESTFWEATRVGTPLHRDGDYVNSAVWDTLTAMWVALEDIKLEAGPFCLVPRSHRSEMWDGHLNDYNNDTKIPIFDKHKDTQRRLKQGAMLHKAITMARLPVIAPRLNKGDAIFWDGKIVHGSMSPKPGVTRYSIAGHYIPADDALIKHGKPVGFESRIVNGMKLRINPKAGEQ